MLFTEPTPFREALDSRAVKSALPTSLGSAELQRLAPELRERALFSARVTNAEFLQRFHSLVEKIINPRRVQRNGATVTEGMDIATARLEMKEYLDSINYQADREDSGTLKDLRSDRRLNLILETNTQMAQGYGYWQQGQDPVLLDEWPASELYRAEEREEERDWTQRWLAAASAAGDDDAARVLRETGRFIARKDSPIWVNLGPFKLPYPPFDFGSGMDVQDVTRDEAMSVGLMGRDDMVQPQSRDFNDDLQASPAVRNEALRSVLESDGYEFDGETLIA